MNGSWVRLRLDVERFEPDAFAVAVDRCRREGIRFTTLAALGDDDLHRRRLYELNRVCSADIPGRGDGWVGMSAASDHRDLGYFFNEMTGVVRSHRGRGIALAMKVLVIERVHTLGVPAIYTVHHAANTAPIALNRKLGYVDTDGPASAP